MTANMILIRILSKEVDVIEVDYIFNSSLK